jgi:hypothetical protein
MHYIVKATLNEAGVEWGDPGRLAEPFEDSVKKAAEKKSETGR